ncbi:MAG: folate family ECF transporter S component [Bacillota bacterium]|nr:folate family ECF transporter S component [Bacillota bacterium]MDW7683093.1 folate family ECF transporter S component [Bacillota bacterium]
MKLNIRQTVHAGFLTGLSIVLTRLVATIMIGNFVRLSFGAIPIYIAGLLFGPAVGGLVGGVADGLGFFVNNFGAAFTPHIFVASVLRGIIPPLVVRAVGNNGRNWLLKVSVAVLLTEIVSSLIFTTWGLSWLYNTPIIAMLPGRIISTAFLVPIYTTITYMLTVKLRYFVSSYSVSS